MIVTCRPTHSGGTLAGLRPGRAGLLRARHRRRAALLELERQRLDVLDVHLIADLHLREILHLSPAVSVTSLPSGPFSVTARVAASIAVIVAVSLTVSATPALPGLLGDDRGAGLGGGGHGESGENGETDASNQVCALLCLLRVVGTER